MFTKLTRFFKPPEYESVERSQKARFLHFSLLVASAACILLGIQNMSGPSDLNVFLFIVGGICLLCIPANQRGWFRPVALFIASVFLALITYSLIAGVGLKDAGMIAYPIFIIFTSYMFSTRAIVTTTLASLASVVLVYTLERTGQLKPASYSNESQLIVLLILLPAAGLLLWVVMDNWEKAMKNLRDTYDMTLAGWGQALEYRDRDSEGHSQRVVGMTLVLAERLGLGRAQLEHIRRGALLHDIGKIAIPDSILLKPGSLSEAEWEIVRKHPGQARYMLERIPFLKPALDIPYSHHECWDGSGYPEGLAGEAIPLAARIFAVVDTWDALVSERPYHQPWSAQESLDYIRLQSGIRFDPQVVQAFLEIMQVAGKPASRA